MGAPLAGADLGTWVTIEVGYVACVGGILNAVRATPDVPVLNVGSVAEIPYWLGENPCSTW